MAFHTDVAPNEDKIHSSLTALMLEMDVKKNSTLIEFITPKSKKTVNKYYQKLEPYKKNSHLENQALQDILNITKSLINDISSFPVDYNHLYTLATTLRDQITPFLKDQSSLHYENLSTKKFGEQDQAAEIRSLQQIRSLQEKEFQRLQSEVMQLKKQIVTQQNTIDELTLSQSKLQREYNTLKNNYNLIIAGQRQVASSLVSTMSLFPINAAKFIIALLQKNRAHLAGKTRIYEISDTMPMMRAITASSETAKADQDSENETAPHNKI